MNNPQVAVIMGSDSDLPLVKKTIDIFKKFNVEFDIKILSAHRTPDKVRAYIIQSEQNGIKVFIGAAGKAAHLPGVIASFTTMPVIGLPIKSSLDGLDALLSIVQMPAGIPVATVAIDGSENAAILAIQILAINNDDLQHKLKEHRLLMEFNIEEKNRTLEKSIREGV